MDALVCRSVGGISSVSGVFGFAALEHWAKTVAIAGNCDSRLDRQMYVHGETFETADRWPQNRLWNTG
jgi:hypothetical protein